MKNRLLCQILDLNEQVQNGAVFQINSQYVSVASRMVSNGKFSSLTTEEIIANLCAINLLNAAIKKKEFKKQLSYGFIKGSAVELIEKINTLKNSGISYYYNSAEHCLYFKFGEIIFSFHEVSLTPAILKANHNEPIEWGGIRLQKIAQPLFTQACSYAGIAISLEGPSPNRGNTCVSPHHLKKTTFGDLDALKKIKEKFTEG